MPWTKTGALPPPPTGDFTRLGDALGDDALGERAPPLVGLRAGESGRPRTGDLTGERGLPPPAPTPTTPNVLLGETDLLALCVGVGGGDDPPPPGEYGDLGVDRALAAREPPLGEYGDLGVDCALAAPPREEWEGVGDLDRSRGAGDLRRRRRPAVEGADAAEASLEVAETTLDFLRCPRDARLPRDEGREVALPSREFLDPSEPAEPGLPTDPLLDGPPFFPPVSTPTPAPPRLLVLLDAPAVPAAKEAALPSPSARAPAMDSSSCADDSPVRGDSGATEDEGIVERRFLPTCEDDAMDDPPPPMPTPVPMPPPFPSLAAMSLPLFLLLSAPPLLPLLLFSTLEYADVPLPSER